VCDLDMMGAPSELSVIRKAAALGRARPTFELVKVNRGDASFIFSSVKKG
jgi:hypothetical protein